MYIFDGCICCHDERAWEALNVLAVGNVDVLSPHSEESDERKEQRG